jgi:hypothetical protein
MNSNTLSVLQAAAIAWEQSSKGHYWFTTEFQSNAYLLRLNDFPAEPICTVFIDGVEFDLDDFPGSWTLPEHRKMRGQAGSAK